MPKGGCCANGDRSLTTYFIRLSVHASSLDVNFQDLWRKTRKSWNISMQDIG